MFLIALYSPKNDNKQPSEMRNLHRRSYFTVTKGFYRFWTHFDDRPKIYRQIHPNIFYLSLSYENKVIPETESI